MPERPTDGGPAFPQHMIETRDGAFLASYDAPYGAGLSVRDYFAAKAMHALLREEYTNRDGIKPDRRPLYDVDDPEQAGTVAFLAYKMADAMLQARAALSSLDQGEPPPPEGR